MKFNITRCITYSPGFCLSVAQKSFGTVLSLAAASETQLADRVDAPEDDRLASKLILFDFKFRRRLLLKMEVGFSLVAPHGNRFVYGLSSMVCDLSRPADVSVKPLILLFVLFFVDVVVSTGVSIAGRLVDAIGDDVTTNFFVVCLCQFDIIFTSLFLLQRKCDILNQKIVKKKNYKLIGFK